MSHNASLVVVKVLHTAVWLFFVVCILGAPLAAFLGHLTLAWVSLALIACEAAVLLANRWKCPLTNLAERYTDRREHNFDIYLPLWLAEHNKSIFTPLAVLSALYVVWVWWRTA